MIEQNSSRSGFSELFSKNSQKILEGLTRRIDHVVISRPTFQKFEKKNQMMRLTLSSKI